MKRLSVFIFLIFGAVQRAQAGDLPGYDFHYSVSGDSSISPAQVFDDGHHLYLQLRDQTLVPALFIRTVNGVTRLPVHPDFPYLVADRLAPEIMLKLDNQQAIVRYTGGRAFSNGSRADGSASVLASNRSASVPDGLSFNHAPSTGNDRFRGELIFRRNGEISGMTPAVASPYVPSARSVTDGHVPGRFQKTADIAPAEKASHAHDADVPVIDVPVIPDSVGEQRRQHDLHAALHLSLAKEMGMEDYTVKKGDSLWRIAHRKGISVAALVACNHLRQSGWLRVGQVLQVPEWVGKQAKAGWQAISWRK